MRKRRIATLLGVLAAAAIGFGGGWLAFAQSSPLRPQAEDVERSLATVEDAYDVSCTRDPSTDTWLCTSSPSATSTCPVDHWRYRSAFDIRPIEQSAVEALQEADQC